MVSQPQNDEEVTVALLASTLAENLAEKTVANNDQIPKWLKELWTHPRLESLSENDRKSILQEAFPMALEQARQQPPPKPSNPASLSFLEQLALFAPKINAMESLQTAVADATRELSPGHRKQLLTALKQIEFLEDLYVLEDWKNLIRNLMYQGLLMDPDGFLPLHRDWFDKARTSHEYAMIQYELCHNVTRAIGETSLPELQTLWHNMWLDRMSLEISLYTEDLWEPLGRTMLNHIFTMDPVAHHMVQLDPCARWFSSWAAHVEAPRIVILLRETGVSFQIRHSTASLQPVERHQLAILIHVLVFTRVSLFPWDLIPYAAPQSTSAEPTRAQAQRVFLLKYVLQGLEDSLVSETRSAKEMALLCSEGLEALLWGCWQEPKSFTTLLEHLHDSAVVQSPTTAVPTQLCSVLQDLLACLNDGPSKDLLSAIVDRLSK